MEDGWDGTVGWCDPNEMDSDIKVVSMRITNPVVKKDKLPFCSSLDLPKPSLDATPLQRP
jgi:hypothetical protein